jgi:hypothetical protein
VEEDSQTRSRGETETRETAVRTEMVKPEPRTGGRGEILSLEVDAVRSRELGLRRVVAAAKIEKKAGTQECQFTIALTLRLR